MKRSEALALGLSQFTTGKPCKNGHLSYRYTSSGSCAACIVDHRNGEPRLVAPVPRGERASSALSRVPERVLEDFKTNSIEIRLRAYIERSPLLFQMVEAYNIARWPEIPPDAYRPRGKPTGRAAGTALFEVRCHAGDYEALLQESNVLLRPAAVVRPDWVRINSEFDAEEQRSDGWPTHDPR